jgi:glyoxylase-like metal-dependent hydrolase (beta-lactamase superfamily II)
VSALVPVTENVWQVPLLPRDALNAYLVGDVLVDAGLPTSAGRLLAALRDRPVAVHLLTHAHPDHLGASAAVCEARDVPLWCGARDRRAAETGRISLAYGDVRRRLFRVADPLSGRGHPVERVLHEGDVIAGFEVIETPGHTPGHLSLWRASDGVVILGDVASHRNPLALRSGLHPSSRLFTGNRAENLRSIRRIAALRPRLVCFGHGPPLRDGERFVRWANSLLDTDDPA